VKSQVRLPGDLIFRLRLHQNLDPVDCRLRVSLKRYVAFYFCGRWAPAIPTWVTTQSHDLLSMFVDFGLSVTNTQSHDLLSMCCTCTYMADRTVDICILEIRHVACYTRIQRERLFLLHCRADL